VTTGWRGRIRAVQDWTWETRIFRAATAVALLHALDDAFLGRQPGVGLGQHALAALLALAAGIAAIVSFPRLRPGFRVGLSLLFGVLGFVNGVLHLAHVTKLGAADSDLTGVLAFAAGIVLVGLGIAIPYAHRGEGAPTRPRRWAYRGLAVLAGIVVVYVFLFPVSAAVVVTHKYREAIGDPPGRAYEPVTFEASDGLRLSGWYVPSRNGAAVVLVHGGGGDRTGAVPHARLLARHGYGVLLYDSRGRGESDGSPNALGWRWSRDVAGALAFLAARPDVEPGRIGGLGLSTGADVLLELAGDRRELKAIVADGASAGSFADYRNLVGLDAGAPFYWTMYTAARVLSGSGPGDPLEEAVARISPTPLLLIAAGRGVAQERDFNRLYAEAAREPVELWDLPQVRHTAAIRERSREYEERVVGLFDRALLGGG
jgi:hypothetical protein